jgi:hypothetical protein
MKMFSTSMAQRIVNVIINDIRAAGEPYSAWYCGIAADPNDRLLNGHNAGGADCHARYWDCGSATVARQVEKALLEAGCKGGGSGGDYETKFVYVYKITARTVE